MGIMEVENSSQKQNMFSLADFIDRLRVFLIAFAVLSFAAAIANGIALLLLKI